MNIPHYRAIIFRKTYPQLSELIDRSREIFKPSFPGARYNSTEHVWSFPSGAKIYFGNMQTVADRVNYQGKRYDFIGFDELTHFTWEEYSYMMSRNRPGGPGTRVYIRATTNPGGVGHGWVKERFITPAKPLTPIKGEYTVIDPEGKKITLERSRIFVPATVFDNAILLQNDPNYLANLAMMPEAERAALLYGSWDSFDGQVFREWKNDPAHYKDRLWTHVIDPFRIPKRWQIYRSFDFGYSKPFSVGWYTVDERGCVYRIAEYYGMKTDSPNVGVQLDPVRIAEEIRRFEDTSEVLKDLRRPIIGVADPAIFDESRGESIAQMMTRHPNYIYWTKGDNTRIAGKMQFHYRFAFGEDGRPLLQVFNTCKHFIRTIPALVYSERNVEDINTDLEDHIYDECRYFLMEHPIPAREDMAVKPKEYDPLDLMNNDNTKSFDFWRL